MTIHRFYCPDLAAQDVVSLPEEEARHAARVLRLGPGDPVELFDGAGSVAVGVVEHCRKTDVSIRVTSRQQRHPSTSLRLSLFTALPRTNRQGFLFEKCAELGVFELFPVSYARSTVRPQAGASDRARRTAIEAAKQCKSPWSMQVHDPHDFTDTLAMAAGFDLACFGDVQDSSKPFISLLTGAPVANAAVWIGPEGGLTEEEIARLTEAGVRPASLGANVLRIETAAISAAAIVSALCGQAGNRAESC